jgi:hypothetical protein
VPQVERCKKAINSTLHDKSSSSSRATRGPKQPSEGKWQAQCQSRSYWDDGTFGDTARAPELYLERLLTGGFRRRRRPAAFSSTSPRARSAGVSVPSGFVNTKVDGQPLTVFPSPESLAEGGRRAALER